MADRHRQGSSDAIPVTQVKIGNAVREQGHWARVVSVESRGDLVLLGFFRADNTYPYYRDELVEVQR